MIVSPTPTTPVCNALIIPEALMLGWDPLTTIYSVNTLPLAESLSVRLLSPEERVAPRGLEKKKIMTTLSSPKTV